MKNGITVRRAETRDAEKIAELLRYIASLHASLRPDVYKDGDIAKHDADGVRGMINDPENIIFSAEIGTETAGYAIAKLILPKEHAVLRPRKVLYVDDLCVDPRHQRSGAGRALMEECVCCARELGCDALELNVWEANSDALAFYERFGMKTQRRRMEMSLTAPENEK